MSKLIVLTDDYPKQTMAMSVPGAYFDRDEHHAWVLAADELTPRSAAVALKLFPHLSIDHPELSEARDSMVQDVRPFDNATPFGVRIEAPMVQANLNEESKELYEFQAIDLGYCRAVLGEHGSAYVGWDRGLGKTIGALALIEATSARQTLIVSPNTSKSTVWEPHVKQYLGDFFDHIWVLPNVKAQRNRTLDWARDAINAGRSVCLISHYEALAIIGGKDGRGWKQFGEWDIVIADEAHRIKNPKAKMTRALKKVPTKHKLALSGSIIQNHAEELFSPLQWMYPDRYKSKWRDWNDRFLDFVENGYSKVCVGVRLDRLEEMRDELGIFMVYRRKVDELDLPKRVDEELRVVISPAQRKAYNELVETCMTELEDGTSVKAQEGLVMLTKLRQLATGLDLVGEEVKDSSKLDVAMELIQDNEDEAFVVFSWFKAAAYSLAERLDAAGIEAFVITGDVKQAKRGELIARFQEGEGRVMIGTISTMGESVNLFRANNAIFIDRSWNPAMNAQAEDRIYRIGQEKPVTITHLIAQDTVDEHRVLPTIVNKEALRRLILGGS